MLRAALAAAVLTGLSAFAMAQDDPEAAARGAYDDALDAYRAGRIEESQRICKRIIRDFPSMEDPYLLLAWVLREDGNAAEASDVYQALLKEHVGFVDARLYRARILLQDLRDFSGAEREYRSARDAPKATAEQRKEGGDGLKAVKAGRDRRAQLRGHRSFLVRALVIALAAWAGLAAAVYLVTKRS